MRTLPFGHSLELLADIDCPRKVFKPCVVILLPRRIMKNACQRRALRPAISADCRTGPAGFLRQSRPHTDHTVKPATRLDDVLSRRFKARGIFHISSRIAVGYLIETVDD